MEYYQNNTVIEQPEREPVSTGLQVAAMVLGIIGVVMGYICYMIMLMNQVNNAVSIGVSEFSDVSASFSGNSIVLAVIVLTFLLSSVAIILGAVGLVRSIRRPRTVKGIVFSAVGLSCGIAGLIFAFFSVFVNGIFSSIMDAVSKM